MNKYKAMGTLIKDGSLEKIKEYLQTNEEVIVYNFSVRFLAKEKRKDILDLLFVDNEFNLDQDGEPKVRYTTASHGGDRDLLLDVIRGEYVEYAEFLIDSKNRHVLMSEEENEDRVWISDKSIQQSIGLDNAFAKKLITLSNPESLPYFILADACETKDKELVDMVYALCKEVGRGTVIYALQNGHEKVYEDFFARFPSLDSKLMEALLQAGREDIFVNLLKRAPEIKKLEPILACYWSEEIKAALPPRYHSVDLLNSFVDNNKLKGVKLLINHGIKINKHTVYCLIYGNRWEILDYMLKRKIVKIEAFRELAGTLFQNGSFEMFETLQKYYPDALQTLQNFQGKDFNEYIFQNKDRRVIKMAMTYESQPSIYARCNILSYALQWKRDWLFEMAVEHGYFPPGTDPKLEEKRLNGLIMKSCGF